MAAPEPTTGTYGREMSKRDEVSQKGWRVVKDRGSAERSDPSTQKCHEASPSLYVCVCLCVAQIKRKADREQETAIEKVSLWELGITQL